MAPNDDSTRTCEPREDDATTAEGTLAATVVRDPQEVDFLPARHGREWTPAEVDREVRDFKQALTDTEADAAGRVWRVARKLDEIYNGFAERASCACAVRSAARSRSSPSTASTGRSARPARVDAPTTPRRSGRLPGH